MTEQNNSSEDAQTTENNECTLVINPDTIVDAMERNARDKDTRRSHRIRFDRPLEGHVEGSIHVQQEGNRWANPETAPLVLRAEQFVNDDKAGRPTQYPEQWQIFQAAKEMDDVDDLEDVSDDTLSKCWDVHTGIWEDTIRHNLKDNVDINEYNGAASTVVPVETTEK
jgi:hypothetical protein